MYKTLTIGLLVTALCFVSFESAQAFGGRRRVVANYAAPGVAYPQAVGVPTAQYPIRQYQAPVYNNYRSQPQDAAYAYPKTDPRRFNFQYNHN